VGAKDVIEKLSIRVSVKSVNFYLIFILSLSSIRRGRKADDRYDYRTALEAYTSGLKAMQAVINRGILTPRYHIPCHTVRRILNNKIKIIYVHLLPLRNEMIQY
jgi:hypothetical protein